MFWKNQHIPKKRVHRLEFIWECSIKRTAPLANEGNTLLINIYTCILLTISISMNSCVLKENQGHVGDIVDAWAVVWWHRWPEHPVVPLRAKSLSQALSLRPEGPQGRPSTYFKNNTRSMQTTNSHKIIKYSADGTVSGHQSASRWITSYSPRESDGMTHCPRTCLYLTIWDSHKGNNNIGRWWDFIFMQSFLLGLG